MAEQNTSNTSERAEALARTVNAKSTNLSHSNVFLIAMERHRGFTTPAEEFLWDLAMLYEHGRLSPEWAQAKLGEFTENWSLAKVMRDRILSEHGVVAEPPKPPARPDSPLDADDLKLGKLLEDIAALDKFDRDCVRAFLTVVSQHVNNNVTPVESAIVEMTRWYEAYYSALTSPQGAGKWRFGLADLRRKIDEVEEWMDDAIKGAKHIARVYPYLLNPEGDNAAA